MPLGQFPLRFGRRRRLRNGAAEGRGARRTQGSLPRRHDEDFSESRRPRARRRLRRAHRRRHRVAQGPRRRVREDRPQALAHQLAHAQRRRQRTHGRRPVRAHARGSLPQARDSDSLQHEGRGVAHERTVPGERRALPHGRGLEGISREKGRRGRDGRLFRQQRNALPLHGRRLLSPRSARLALRERRKRRTHAPARSPSRAHGQFPLRADRRLDARQSQLHHRCGAGTRHRCARQALHR